MSTRRAIAVALGLAVALLAGSRIWRDISSDPKSAYWYVFFFCVLAPIAVVFSTKSGQAFVWRRSRWLIAIGCTMLGAGFIWLIGWAFTAFADPAQAASPPIVVWGFVGLAFPGSMVAMMTFALRQGLMRRMKFDVETSGSAPTNSSGDRA